MVSFQVALEFDSTNADALAGIAEARTKSGVQADYSRLMNEGDRLLRSGRNLAALGKFQQALATGYNRIEATAQIQVARARLEGDFQDLVDQGDKFKEAGYLDMAKQKYREALRIKNDPAVRGKLNQLD